MSRDVPNEDGPWVTVINLSVRTAQCSVCGREDLSQWGLPVSSETGEIVANDYPGDWGGIPACRECWLAHESGAFVGTYPKF